MPNIFLSLGVKSVNIVDQLKDNKGYCVRVNSCQINSESRRNQIFNNRSYLQILIEFL